MPHHERRQSGGKPRKETSSLEEQLRKANEQLVLAGLAAEQAAQREKALREQVDGQRERLETVLQQMPSGVVIAQAPSGKLVLGNQQVEKIWRHPFLPSATVEQYREWRGYHREDGRPYEPEEWPLARSIATGEVVIDEEIDIQRGDDTYGTITVSSAPVRDRDGRIVAGVVTLTDVTERKQAQEALRRAHDELEAQVEQRTADLARSEQRFRHLAESARDLVYRYRLLPDPCFEYVSPSATAITGYTPKEHYADPELGIKIVHPDDRPLLEAMREGGDPLDGPIILRWIRKDGTVLWTEHSINPVHDKAGHLAALEGTARDVTERVRAEMASAELAAIVGSSEDAIIGKTLDGVITSWNTAAASLYGYSAAESIGRHIAMLIPPDLADELPLIEDRLRRGERIQHFETKRLRKDGRVIDVLVSLSPTRDAAGRIVGAASIAHDITELKRSERLARDARAYAETIVDTVREPLLVLSSNLRVSSANRSFYQTFNTSPHETEDCFVYELSDGDWDIPTLRELLGEVSLTGSHLEDFEVEQDFTTIGHKTMLLNARRLALGGGLGPLILLAIEDITERKRAEQFREQYTSLIAHDLRNPLTVVMGMADLLLRMLAERGMEREASTAEHILDGAKRMEGMLRDMIAVARMEGGQLLLHKEPTDLLRLVDDIRSRIGSAEDARRIETKASEYVPPALVDPGQIERAIVNLVTNALKYSPSDKPVIMHVGRNDGEAIISVTDQGGGILEQERSRLFERFYRTSTSGQHEGLGLGLYITRLIVEAHGGQVSVESKVGEGSSFRFTLPLA